MGMNNVKKTELENTENNGRLLCGIWSISVSRLFGGCCCCRGPNSPIFSHIFQNHQMEWKKNLNKQRKAKKRL
jgi:hypothetical protein